MHLFPHVQFPGDVGICVILIAGPAVELSLDDFSFNGQLSGHCKPKCVSWSFCCLLLGNYTLLPFETYTWGRSSVRAGTGAHRGRFHGLGNLWSCTFTMMEALILLLALTREKNSHLIFTLTVCTYRMCTLHTGRGGFAIWSFSISIASWWGSALFANFFVSPFLHTQTHTRNKSQWSGPLFRLSLPSSWYRPRSCRTGWLVLFDDVFNVVTGIHALRVCRTGSNHVLWWWATGWTWNGTFILDSYFIPKKKCRNFRN